MQKTPKSGTDQKQKQKANLMPALKCYLHKSDPNVRHCHVNVGQGQNLNVDNVKYLTFSTFEFDFAKHLHGNA